MTGPTHIFLVRPRQRAVRPDEPHRRQLAGGVPLVAAGDHAQHIGPLRTITCTGLSVLVAAAHCFVPRQSPCHAGAGPFTSRVDMPDGNHSKFQLDRLTWYTMGSSRRFMYSMARLRSLGCSIASARALTTTTGRPTESMPS